jgi:hypothetical protein
MNLDTQPTLTDLIVELYQRATGRPPTESIIDTIFQYRWDCDLEDDAKVPAWLTDMLRAALQGRETGVVRFEQIGSDVSSFLFDASEMVPGWKHDDHGEAIEIALPLLGVHIHLSRESRNDSGAHCSSYNVTRTRAAAG